MLIELKYQYRKNIRYNLLLSCGGDVGVAKSRMVKETVHNNWMVFLCIQETKCFNEITKEKIFTLDHKKNKNKNEVHYVQVQANGFSKEFYHAGS